MGGKKDSSKLKRKEVSTAAAQTTPAKAQLKVFFIIPVGITVFFYLNQVRAPVATITPDSMVTLLSDLPVVSSPFPALFEPGSENDLGVRARWLAHQQDYKGAVAAYLDAIEVAPTDETLRAELFEIYKHLYPEGAHGTIRQNHTAEFAEAMKRNLRSTDAELISLDPPIYTLHHFVNEAEIAALLEIRERRLAEWSKVHPLICFRHDAYTGHVGLQSMWGKMVGQPGLGGQGCLGQWQSQHVAPAIPFSESLFVSRNEEALLDEIGIRMQQRLGLNYDHCKQWQILSYRQGTAYHEHTDCETADHLFDEGTRMATVLVYLNDDFDGGETEFPKLGLKVKPPRGSAIVFYNFGPGFGGQQCNPATLHRSNPVARGSKLVLQHWYTYRFDPYLAQREFRREDDGMLPKQPTVSCDYVQGDINVSCRWYNDYTVYA